MSAAKRVLVVEDDDHSRTALCDFLQAKGFQIQKARDAEEGLWLFERLRPDAIVLDAHLPRVDGFEFLQRLRRGPDGRHTMVVMVTAVYDDDEHRALAETHGVQDYLTKPVDLSYLVARLGGAPSEQPVPSSAPAAEAGRPTALVRGESWDSFVALPLREVSEDGLFACTEAPLGLLSRARVRLRSPRDASEIELRGEVMYVVSPEHAAARGLDPGFSVRFPVLTAEERRALSALRERLTQPPRERRFPVLSPEDLERVETLARGYERARAFARDEKARAAGRGPHGPVPSAASPVPARATSPVPARRSSQPRIRQATPPVGSSPPVPGRAVVLPRTPSPAPEGTGAPRQRVHTLPTGTRLRVEDVAAAQAVPPPATPRRAATPPAEPSDPGERIVAAELKQALARLEGLSPYERIGVMPGADARTIKHAFLDLSRKHHPDLFVHHKLPEIRKLAQEIYLLLSETERGLTKEARLMQGEAAAAGAAPARGTPTPLVGNPTTSPLPGTPAAHTTSPLPRAERSTLRTVTSPTPPAQQSSPRPPAGSPRPHPTPVDELAASVGSDRPRQPTPSRPSPASVPPAAARPSRPPAAARPSQPPAAGKPTGEQGIEALRQKRYLDAKNLLQHALQRRPNDTALLVALELARGHLAIEQGNRQQALEHCHRARRLEGLGAEAKRAVDELERAATAEGGLFSRLRKK
ncbi:MAG: response regulator [Deltaproteobacteria bacterium]|nr:response regulator [Deltaproteobacteria bacterium]